MKMTLQEAGRLGAQVRSNNIRRKFAPNKLFGYWRVIGIDPDNSNGLYINVMCRCGAVEKRRSASLSNGRSTGCKNCTVAKGSKSGRWSGYKDMPGNVFHKIKSGAKNRNIEYEFDDEAGKKYLYEVFHAQKGKCYYSGTELNWKTASLDRKDSTKGYIKNNVVWTTKKINLMKHEQSEDEFILNCMKVVMHNKEVASALFNPIDMTESLRDDIAMDVKFDTIRKLNVED